MSNPVETPDAAGKRMARQIDQAFEEVARLSGSNLPPTNFYQEFLAKVTAGIESPAGAVWLRTPQGFLQLQCQVNLEQVGLDNQRGGRQVHNELLRQAFQTVRPMMLEPFSNTGIVEGAAPAGNPTEFTILLAPILIDEKQAVGLVELWQSPRWDARVQRTYLNYLVQMAGYASNYVRQSSGRQSNTQEQLWLQLEAFALQIHSSLKPQEVAFTVANEGRRLIGSDRLSVALRMNKKTRIEGVSGADVIERRSTLIRLMQRLTDQVIKWGDKLVYKGTADEGLPPKVAAALDEYLAESNSKLLVVQPLYDDRDKKKDKDGKQLKPKTARSALVMESFDPPAQVEPLIARTEVVGRHAASALYNAAELKRIPLPWLWKPVAAVQDGLGGKTKAIIWTVTAALIALTATLILVPYPLKLDAQGQLMPEERRWVYSKRDAEVRRFLVDTGSVAGNNQVLVEMFDPELQKKLTDLKTQLHSAEMTRDSLQQQLNQPNLNPDDRSKLSREIGKQRVTAMALGRELQLLQDLTSADANRPGYFFVKAPQFAESRIASGAEPVWTVLNSGFKETMTNRKVTPGEPILRMGNKRGAWEIELKIPQKHVGQVLAAFPSNDPNAELDVDLLVTSRPTAKYKGKLSRSRVAGEAVPNRDDHNESEPVVLAYVRVSGEDIPEEYRIPSDLLLTGVEVRTRIRCGDHAMGYSMFYGVYEFFYENVAFQF